MSSKSKASFWQKATEQLSNQVHNLTAGAEKTLKDTQSHLSSTKEVITTLAQTSTLATKSKLEEAQSHLDKATQRANEVVHQTIEQASQSFTMVQDDTREVFKKVHTHVEESTQQLISQTTQVKQSTQQQLDQVMTSTKNQAIKASQHIDHVMTQTHHVVADGIESLVGDRGQPVSSFVRDGGLLTLAGVAFRPIAFAKRGVDSYKIYQDFIKGDITLGILLLEIIAPGAVDVKSYLSDPSNQTELLQMMRKVIPDSVIEKSLGLSTSLSEHIEQTLTENSMSGPTLSKFQELLNYKRPKSEVNQDRNSEADSTRLAEDKAPVEVTTQLEKDSSSLSSTNDEVYITSSSISGTD